MKRCTKCDLKKELNEFYKSNKNNDGYHNSCKVCWKKQRSECYVKNREKVRKQCREYYVKNSEYLREKYRGQKKTLEQVQRWRNENPEKYKAHYTVSNALARNIIKKKESCEVCNSKTKLHAHHKDYSKPLEILWVCAFCHSKIHNKRK